MKILTFSNYFPEHTGGIEFVAWNLVKRWRQRHQVYWVACDIPERPHVSRSDDLPLPAFNFTEENLGFPYPIPLGNSLLRIFRQARGCDVIHIHDCLYLANLLGVLASHLYKKPLLITQHIGLVPYKEGYKNILQKLAYATLGKFALGSARQVVFISERVKRWFESQMNFHQAPILIPNGVDIHLFYPSMPEERKVIRAKFGFLQSDIILLFVGRFTQKKGVHLIRELAFARPSHRWIMVGNGEFDPHEWGLSNVQVIPPQPQSELRQYYAAADLFVLPSVGEGVPLAVQESLACGLPVAVSHETASFLPEAPLLELDISSHQTMLKALDDLLESDRRLAALSEASNKFAQQFSWDEVAQKYESLFEDLTSSHHHL